MIWSHNIESLFGGNRDPFGGRKVHIPLTEVQAIGWQIGSTIACQKRVKRTTRVGTYLKIVHTSCASARPSRRREEKGISTGLRPTPCCRSFEALC